MGSTFGTYSVAYSGMYTSQASLATVSNNLANINTTGYSRTRASDTDTSKTLADGTTLVNGSNVQAIYRLRDQLLDSTYREQNSDANYWSVKYGNLEYMQELLNQYEADDGTSSTNIQTQIEDFFDSWEELTTDATNTSYRQTVIENAKSLVSSLSALDSQLQQLQEDAVNSVKDGVDSLNDLASQVAELNKQIVAAEGGGGEASYLRDQRDELVDEMSSLANVKVNELADGSYQVTIGGVALVSGDTVHQLTVTGQGTTASPLAVRWADFDCKADIGSGSINAYLEDANPSGYEDITTTGYDYSATATSSISNLRQALNDLVTTLATNINSLLSSGTALDGTSSGADYPLFTVVDEDGALSLSNIQVNPDLLDDSSLLAVSSTGEKGDSTIAGEIADLIDDDSLYTFDGLSMDIIDFYQSTVSWIATEGSNASSAYETQTSLVNQVDSQRQSVSSVSTDEEMSNMIIFQNAYAASARVLSTIDGLIGDLIATF